MTNSSPSLHKMEGYKQESFGRRKRFNAGNIFGDPFALATISVALIAWVIAFAASVVSAVQKTGYPNFSWWTLVFTLLTIIGIIVAVASDTAHIYQVAIVGFLSAGLAFTTSSVNSLIYLTDGAQAHDAASAGFILLSIVSIVWIFYFGSTPAAPHRQTIDSLALQKEGRMSSRTSRRMTHGNFRPETTISQQPQMYTSAQLSGFETSSPVTGFPGGAIGANDNGRNSEVRFGPPPSRGATETVAGSTVAPGPDYPYRARAVYSYEANPEDANEISFAKHEILEVSDVSGRWWQAKKSNGETGIAPSNYLILL